MRRIWDKRCDRTTFVRKVRSPQIIDSYLSNNTLRKLQLGTGSNSLQGWLNTDIEPQEGQAYLDVGERFPLPDNSVRYIHGEQLIEHLPYEIGVVMLRESFRVLEPGGKIRIATPDLRRLIALYDDDDTELEGKFMDAETHRLPSGRPTRCDIMNMYFRRWGHVYVYDQETLTGAIRKAGFRDILRVELNESDDPELRNIDQHARGFGAEPDKYITMVIQATK